MNIATFDFAPYQMAPDCKTTYLPAVDLNLADATSVDTISALLDAPKCNAVFINAHCCNEMQRNETYKTAVTHADLRLPDGFGITLAAKMTGQSLAANLNGTDLIPQLLQQAATRGKSVYLFGATPGTADKAADALTRKIPHLRIAGTRDGFDGAQNEAAVVADMNASGADIVLVALGVPAQEIWLHRNCHRLTAQLTMGVGAALDFFAGNVRRAPLWVRKLRCEWVWRLAMEPRRLAKRYLIGNVTFLARAKTTALRQISRTSMLRRALDVTLASTALVLLAPLFAATAMAIKWESKGPVFFRQTRVGQNGTPFTMIKFRSMGVDAEARRAAVLDQSDREGLCFKSRNDPRITKVGRFIRRFSIDELPQVINVLRGEMAVVGPRPALPCEVAAYPTRALGRLDVKPGLTGVWQVSGRADVGFEHMIDMDLAYAGSRSFMLDLILIAMTFRVILSGRGAH